MLKKDRQVDSTKYYTDIKKGTNQNWASRLAVRQSQR